MRIELTIASLLSSSENWDRKGDSPLFGLPLEKGDCPLFYRKRSCSGKRVAVSES
jgi:hypothetical protein